MADLNADPIIRRFREQISDNDRQIVEAINRRLQLVTRLKAYKESRGLDFLDSAREEWILRFLARANGGPLLAEGLREIYTEILDLTKRELLRAQAPLAGSASPADPHGPPRTP